MFGTACWGKGTRPDGRPHRKCAGLTVASWEFRSDFKAIHAVGKASVEMLQPAGNNKYIGSRLGGGVVDDADYYSSSAWGNEADAPAPVAIRLPINQFLVSILV